MDLNKILIYALDLILYLFKEITMLFEILQNSLEQISDDNGYLEAIRALYRAQKEFDKTLPINTFVKEYLSFLDVHENSKKYSNQYHKYELLITKRGLYSDLEKIQSESYVQLKNKLNPIKFKNDCFYEVENKILNSAYNYYFILDSAENLYICNPLINGKKYLSHSSLLHDNWPILAGNISFYNGKIRYLDEESGHFKPRNRIFLFEKIYSNNIYTNDCILKHCHLPELPIEERCQMDRVQNLFDLYKYFFYNKI